MTCDKLRFGDGGYVFNFFYDNGKYPGPRNEYGKAVGVGPAGTVALAGYEERPDLGQGMNWLVTLWGPPETPVKLPDGIRAWPNPFDPSAAAGGCVKIGLLPEGGRARIYTVSGLLVREVEARGGVACWDGRAAGGGRAAPGVYYWVATGPGNVKGKGSFMLVNR
jgi:hypothetical protein